MMGIFQEHGPCSVNVNLTTQNNPHSFSEVTNVLYIDQPTHTGFSYSKTVPVSFSALGTKQLSSQVCPKWASKCGTLSKGEKTATASTTPGAAPNFWKTVQGFMGVFPKYARKEIIFATESYGGRYGPIFSEYFTQQNRLNIPNTTKINISALMVGNGWHDALIQYPAYYNFTVNPGNTYDLRLFDRAVEKKMENDLYGPGGCVDQIQDCYKNGTDITCALADAYCDYEMVTPYWTVERDQYDIRQFEPSPYPPEHYQKYLNTRKVLKAIGAFTNYTDGSDIVGEVFASTGDNVKPQTVMKDLQALIERGTTVVLYYGDADYICNWVGGEAVAEKIGAAGFGKAGYVNISTSDGIVHGEVRQSNNFAFARIYESGHMVPYFKPLLSLEMLKRVVKNMDIATGTELVKKGYITKGNQRSTYREGNKTVVWDPFGVPATGRYSVDGGEVLKKWRYQRPGRSSQVKLGHSR
jgi:carboxypeptidase C (cathepsin A)